MENTEIYSQLERQLRDRTNALEAANTLLQKKYKNAKLLKQKFAVFPLQTNSLDCITEVVFTYWLNNS
jgi:nitrate/nitrite-specific signal transduction histidine kinase